MKYLLPVFFCHVISESAIKRENDDIWTSSAAEYLQGYTNYNLVFIMKLKITHTNYLSDKILSRLFTLTFLKEFRKRSVQDL